MGIFDDIDVWPFGAISDAEKFSRPDGLIDQFEEMYGVRNSLDGETNPSSDLNAMAHAYTSAGLAYRWGTLKADFQGFWKEAFGSSDSSEADSERDTHNNDVGQQIGEFARENGLPDTLLDELIYDALQRGLLIVQEYKDPRMNSGFMGSTPRLQTH